MDKVIYLGTTYKCSACKCQEHLLKKALEDRSDIELKICDYTELPNWLQSQIRLSDFPVTIFIKDGIIKYSLIGTMTIKNLKVLMQDICF